MSREEETLTVISELDLSVVTLIILNGMHLLFIDRKINISVQVVSFGMKEVHLHLVLSFLTTAMFIPSIGSLCTFVCT